MTDFNVNKIYNSLNNYYHIKAFYITLNKIIYFNFIFENAIINCLYINHETTSSFMRKT